MGLLEGWTFSTEELLPSEEDFKEIAYSLVRLEEVYEMDFTQSSRLDLEDILTLGKVSFDNMNFKQFHSWYGVDGLWRLFLFCLHLEV